MIDSNSRFLNTKKLLLPTLRGFFYDKYQKDVRIAIINSKMIEKC